MRTVRALLWVSLVGAGGCSSPQPNNPPPPATAAAMTASQTTASAVPTATAQAAASEPACPARRLIGNIGFAPDSQTLATACAGSSQVCNDESGGNAMVDIWSL